MAGPYVESQVGLHRDALGTPWGFRLLGGKDFNAPLTVQRVFVGSPADGELHRGDVIIAIDNYDVTQILHKEAQDLIKKSGGSMSLRVRRSHAGPAASVTSPASSSPSYLSRGKTGPLLPASTNQPASPSMARFEGYGVDYNRPKPAPVHYAPQPGGGGDMLSRVNQSLTEAVWQPHGQEPDPDEYQQRPMRDLKTFFSQPAGQQYQPKQAPRARPKFRPSTEPPSLPEPGWVPKAVQQQQGPHRGQPSYTHQAPQQTYNAPQQTYNAPQQTYNAPQQTYNAPQQTYNAPSKPAYQQQQQQADTNDWKPAWTGSLRHHGGRKPWETPEEAASTPVYIEQPAQGRSSSGTAHVPAHTAPATNVQPHQPKVQHMKYGPGGSQTYEQHGNEYQSDTAQVTHSQYNTPIGLYSQDNVQAALSGQTAGKAGQGTLQVSSTAPGQKKPFNPAQSDVYRLLMEEEERGKAPRSAGPGQAPTQSARYQEQTGPEMHYQGYQDHSHQSRSMQALEAKMAHDDDYGTSDF